MDTRIPVSRSRTWPLALGAACAIAAALPAHALTFAEALALAQAQSPALQSQAASLAGAEAAQGAADSLPDPRLSVGVENLPLTGGDRLSLTRDFMTMTRIGLMQEVPNAAKREARGQGARWKAERERVMLGVAKLQLRQSLVRTWVAVTSVQQRQHVLDEMLQENRKLQDTLPARIAGGGAMAADLLMARQEALALADRRDEFVRDESKARAALRKLVGERAREPLEGEPPIANLGGGQVREQLHGHAELEVYSPMLGMAQAELGEAQAEARGDWSWEVAYQKRGPQWGDMVSFQVSFDLPWQRDRRQQPLIAARIKDVQRIEAERAEMERRHAQEIDEQLAELEALQRQLERLRSAMLPLASERVQLALASYESNRGNLAGVLAARRELLEARMRLIDLQAQRDDLRARLDNQTLEQAR